MKNNLRCEFCGAPLMKVYELENVYCCKSHECGEIYELINKTLTPMGDPNAKL